MGVEAVDRPSGLACAESAESARQSDRFDNVVARLGILVRLFS